MTVESDNPSRALRLGQHKVSINMLYFYLGLSEWIWDNRQTFNICMLVIIYTKIERMTLAHTACQGW